LHADVRVVEHRAGDGGKHEIWERPTCLEPRGALLTSPKAQDRPELERHVHITQRPVLGCRELPFDEVPLDANESATPVEIAPLKGPELAEAQPRPEGAKEERVSPGIVGLSRLEQRRDLVTRVTVDHIALRRVAVAELSTQTTRPKGRVR